MVGEISIETVRRMIPLCRAYDPFTCYIDSYTQQKAAEARNDKLDSQFNECMQEVLDGYSRGIPAKLQNVGADLEQKLIAWLWEADISVAY